MKSLSRFFTLSIILCVAVASSAFAVEKKHAPKAKAAAAPVAASSSYSLHPEAGVTLGFGSIDSRFVYGFGLQMEWPMTLEGSAYAFGVQSGFYYGSKTETIGAAATKIKSRAWTVPILFTGKYFIVSKVDFLKPYFAAGVGLSLDHVNGDINKNGVAEHKSGTDINFAILLRPGITVGAEQKWFAELPLGLFAGEFTILPSVGMHF